MKKQLFLFIIAICMTLSLNAQGTYIEFWPEFDFFKNKNSDVSETEVRLFGKMGIPIQSSPLTFLALEVEGSFYTYKESSGWYGEYKSSFNSYFLAPSLIVYPIERFQISVSPGMRFYTAKYSEDGWSESENIDPNFAYAASIGYDLGDMHGLILGLRMEGNLHKDYHSLTTSFFVRYRFMWL
jgi:hypothetical protein